MTKFFTAFTREVDDAQVAVREICEQLNPAENALKNTIGIVHFYSEFAETGVCQAIIDALPFPLAGCVSSYSAIGKQYGDIALSITMITSDDAHFAVRIIEGLSTESREHISECVTRLCGELCADEMPKMIMPFMSPLPQFSGDELVAAVNSLPQPPPMFGTIAFNIENIENNEGTNFVMGNGKIFGDMYAFVAFYGNIEPKFHITTTFAFDESFCDTVKITDADGPVLKTVNKITALKYLKETGIVTSDDKLANSGIWVVPAILTYPDGTKVVRAFLGIVEGTESIFATGAMNVGAKIRFASLDGEKTLASAEKLMKELTAAKENNFIAYSCAARVWALGTKFFAEAEKVAECAEEYQKINGMPLNYNVAYSGGEICPVMDDNGNLVNALHNYTLIACTFA